MRCVLVLVGAALALPSCKKPRNKTDARQTPETSPEGASTELNDGVPPLGQGAASTSDATAHKLNVEGLKLHKSKDYVASRAKFLASVSLDPNYVMSRYNLACAENLLGNSDAALNLLAEFDQPGCAPCSARLVRARENSD